MWLNIYCNYENTQEIYDMYYGEAEKFSNINRVKLSPFHHPDMTEIPYFFAYKTVFFSFQNNPKNLDPSYKTDLDLWDCLGRVKPVLQQYCTGLI